MLIFLNDSHAAYSKFGKSAKITTRAPKKLENEFYKDAYKVAEFFKTNFKMATAKHSC